MSLRFLQKVNQKYITNKEEFTTLQKIVLHEVEADVAQVRNSATEALLWLKRWGGRGGAAGKI